MIKMSLIILFLVTVIFAQTNEWMIIKNDKEWLNNYSYIVKKDRDNNTWLYSYPPLLIKIEKREESTLAIPKNLLFDGEEVSDFDFDIYNNIWIVTDRNNLITKTNENWMKISLTNDNYDNHFRTQIEVGNDNIKWVVIHDQYLIQFTDTIQNVYNFSSLLGSDTSPQNMFNSADNEIWIIFRDCVLNFRNGSFTKYNIKSDFAALGHNKLFFVNKMPNGIFELLTFSKSYFSKRYYSLGTGDYLSEVFSIESNNSDQVFIGTGRGVFQIKNEQIIDLKGPPLYEYNKAVFKICSINIDEFWCSNTFGNYYYNHGEWIDLNDYVMYKSILPSNNINTISSNSKNRVLVGTQSGMVEFYRDKYIDHNKYYGPLRKNYVENFVVDNSNHVWFCLNRELFLYEDGELTKSYYHNYCKEIYSIFFDKENNKYISSEIGLLKFSKDIETPKLLESYPIYTSYFFDYVFDIYDNLWYGNYLTIYKFDFEQVTKYDPTNTFKDIGNVHLTAIDKNNTKWFGTQNFGLVKYDDISWKIYTTANGSLPSNYITCLSADGKGNMWVGTPVGLVKINGETFTRYNTRNSQLPSAYITALEVDNDNNIWIGTDNGLAIYNENGITINHPREYEEPIPTNCTLSQNYPNPFNESTRIQFSLPTQSRVKIILYTVLGEEIKILYEKESPPGNYIIQYDGVGLSSGIYIYTLFTNHFSLSKKMVYLK